MQNQEGVKPKESGFSAVVKKAQNLRTLMIEERKLTRLFYKSLEAHYLHIKECGRKHKNEAEKRLFEQTLSKISSILNDKANMSWENANFVEQLLIPLYDDDTLDVELNRRLVEAGESLSPTSAAFYSEKIKTSDISARRALLKRIVVDLQWHDQIKELKRVYSRLTRRNTGWMFIFSVILFVVSILFLIHFAKWVSLDWNPAAIEAAGVAMTAGLMGSAFSMLTGLKQRLGNATFDELKIQRRWGLILTRTSIGLGAALILAYFIQARLLEGTFFPKFTFDANGMLPLDLQNLSLLVVWSFIAGFSEKFVPNIISQAEQKVTIKGPLITKPSGQKAEDSSVEAVG